MVKPKLLSLDAFAKTVEDAKIKTASGGMITMGCFIIVFLLLMNEYNDYRTIINRPELVVDRDINKRLEINLDISFPKLPCDLITLDILDVSGELQLDLLKYGFQKYRLTDQGEIATDAVKMNEDLEFLTTSNDPSYCGSCYGSLNQDQNDEKPVGERVCCNSCESVRQAYASKLWGFYDGENIEQCEKEGYVKRIKEQINEGCRVKGTAEINRIAGNLHFAPGASFTAPGRHNHDLSLYNKYKDLFNFDHVINHFSFGPDPDQGRLVHASAHGPNGVIQSTRPLDGHIAKVGEKSHLFSYYFKVVATRFEFLDQHKVETNQFSVITHDRPLRGGRDEDHQHTLHALGGIPGVFFHFEISPLKIINRESYAKTWSGFVLGATSAIAGVLTIGAVLDRTIWAADNLLRQKKDT